MANKFKKGDLVVMKSGGPPMTIDAVPGDLQKYGEPHTEYRCEWFKGATSQGGSFGEHVLEAYVPLKK